MKTQKINDRLKVKGRQRNLEQYAAIKELIGAGELTDDALKHNRFYLAEKRAQTKGTNPEEEIEILSTRGDYKKKWESYIVWSSSEIERLIELVKEYGKDYKSIIEAYEGEKNYQQVVTKISKLKKRMIKYPESMDKEFLDKLENSVYTRRPRASQISVSASGQIKYEVKDELESDVTEEGQIEVQLEGQLEGQREGQLEGLADFED